MDGQELVNKGQNIQKDNSFVGLKKSSNNDGVFMSVSKKAEKITTAIYMVTDFIPNNDPLKNRIREISLSMISDTRKMSYSLTGDLYFQLSRVIASAWEIVSVMEVAVVVGFISDMNYQILKNALIDFISDLRNRQRIEGFSKIHDMKFIQGTAGDIRLKSDFFRVTDSDMERVKEEVLKPEAEDTFKDSSYRTFYKGQTEDTKMSFIKNDQKELINKAKSNPKLNERKDKIYALVKEKKDISITDIVSFFKEYSQKTIQRDLVALVEEGRIKKVGDKRWSRYLSL